ncbi:MAG: ribosome maturation factor RimM [Caldilineaceae bacterium]
MEKPSRRLPTTNNSEYEPPEGYLAVGYIVGVHGLKGELKVELYTDFPERFEAGVEVMIGERLQKYTIESSRPHKTHLLLKLKKIDRREDAELLRSQWILIDEEDAVDLQEDEYWIHEILGLRVLTVEGQTLGEVVDVLQTGANDVYVVRLDPVRGNQTELLLPAIGDVVKTVDLEDETITVQLLPGLLDDSVP